MIKMSKYFKIISNKYETLRKNERLILDKKEELYKNGKERVNQLLEERKTFKEAVEIEQKERNAELNKFIETLSKVEKKDYEIENERIEKAFREICQELGAKNNSLKWGNSPLDEDLGMRIGDDKVALFIKLREESYFDEEEDSLEEIVTGITIEFLTVNPKFRGQRFADKLMKDICRKADEKKVILFLQAVPQDRDTDIERLVEFYKRFGFRFSGIIGVREPK